MVSRHGGSEKVESFTYLGVVFGKRASWSAMEKKLAEGGGKDGETHDATENV